MSDISISASSCDDKEHAPSVSNRKLHNGEQGKSKNKGKGCLWIGLLVFLLFLLGIAGLIIMLLTVGAVAGVASSGSHYNEEVVSGNPFSSDSIAVVDVRGVILTGASSPMYTVANAEDVCRRLQQIGDDESVKAVIIYIDSPGGGVTASDYIHHQILELKKKRNIPIVAMMGPVAASGGYYVAVGCDYIYANHTTITGSIGVVAQTYNYYKLLDRIGVESEVYMSGDMKDMLNGARPRKPEEVEIMQDLINDSYNDFIRLVADGRKDLTVEKILNSPIGDSRIFHGDRAKELGLIDEVGYFADAERKAADMAGLDEYKLIRYVEPFMFPQLFTQASVQKSLSVRIPALERTSIMEAGKLYYLPVGWFSFDR